MAQKILERTGEDVGMLTPQEQQGRLLEHLLKTGVIVTIPSALYQEASRDLHAPAEITGKPVSEILLEDRE